MLKIKRIGSVDILTPDVPRMVDFYHGVLGIPFYMPWDGDEELASLDLTNVIMCLMRTANPLPPPRHAMDFGNDPQGFDSLAFEVDSLAEAVSALDGKVRWINSEDFELRYPNGTYFRNRALHDPDGNMVYIQESHVVRPFS